MARGGSTYSRSTNEPCSAPDDILGDKLCLKQLCAPIESTSGSTSSEDDQLCLRCKRIDLDAIFKVSVDIIPTTHGVPIMPLGHPSNETEVSSCRSRFLFAAVRTPKELPRNSKPDYHLRVFSAFSLLSRRETKCRISKNVSIGLGVLHGRPRKTLKYESETCVASGLIAPIASASPPNPFPYSFTAHMVSPKITNYDQIHRWLDHCQKFHNKLCGLRDSVRQNFLKCIDCFTRDIVQISAQHEYLALSYVWGSAQLNQSSHWSAEFQQKPHLYGIPRVIEDAISVVKGLGQRYLWVDYSCIDQQDTEAKHAQIQNMHNIYEGAYATIVAAVCPTTDSALPGVGDIQRISPTIAFAGDTLLGSTLPHISRPLKSSTWITRGWTYQEAILSRRCLFFTELQVYFMCRMMSCCESIDYPLKWAPVHNPKAASTLGTEMFGDTGRHSKIKTFMDHVEHYSARNLTYDSDSLNAFRGLLARSEFFSFFGIPITPGDISGSGTVANNCSLDFARGLCWKPFSKGLVMNYKSLRRSQGFPSWSWAGWAGKVELLHSVEPRQDCVDIDRNISSLSIKVEDKNGKLIALERLRCTAGEMRILSEISHCLQFEALVVQVRFQRDSLCVGENKVGFCVCNCHPNSAHEGYAHGDPVILCEVPDPDDTRHRNLLSQLWDGVLLFREKHRLPMAILMLIEWHGEVAHRIGLMRMFPEMFDQLPKTRKIIRLE